MRRVASKWVAVVLATVLAAGGCRLERDDRGPSGGSGLERAAEESMRRYARGLAELADETAVRLERGELSTAEDVFDAYQTSSRAVRESAMAPYEEAFDEAARPGGEFDAARAADGLRSMARGFRSAAE